MGSRLKEDERNERTIRNLLKLPENRRCINCNSLGPQYVCTSFWTFICTTCSGIHREFTHRVKSVSMAKFTTQEVSALQGGGNASAKEIYFKEWDAQRQSFPDSSNVERLRDFIKHVYVDRRYSGERSFDKPPRAKMGETTEDTYQGGSRSPPYENERRYSDRPSPGGRSDTSSRNSYDERRSPEYNNQSQDFKKSSPARSDVVNDWRREDRFSKTPDIGRSPDRQKDISSPPLVRPVREILGESVSPLRVIEPPPKTNGGSTSLQPQRTASSSSLASSNGNPPVTELRRESSLIDFDTDDPQPTPSVASVPQTHQIPPSAVPVSLNDNWANFDSTPTPVVTKPMPSSQAPSSGANLLDMLSELSVPASGNNPQMSLFDTSPPPPAAVAPPSAFAPGGGPAAPTPPLFDAFGNSGGGPQWQNVQPQQNVMQPPALFNQAPTPSVDSQVTSKPAAKQELPADLFTSSYSPFGGQGQGAQGWYPAPQYGMGFNMQYNVPMQQQQQHMPPAFGQPPRSANPFDVNESAPTMFPSMAPLQNALPNMGPPPSGIQQAWMPNQPPHPLATPPYGSSMPSGPFMGQPPPNIPSQPQSQSRGQVGNFGYDLTSLGSMNNPNQQQQSGLYTQTTTPTPNTFSSNPFG